MPRKSPSLIGIVLGTWRRLLPSPVQLVRSSISPRRLFRRFRLRYVVLFAAAGVVWMVAVFTEPVPAASDLAWRATTQSATIAQETSSSTSDIALERTVPASPEAAARFFRKVASAVQGGVRTGRVQLRITETEATSALDAVAQIVEIREIVSTLSPEELERLDTPEEIRQVIDARSEAPPTDIWGRIRYAMRPSLRFREAQVRFLPDGRVVVSGYAHAWSRRAPVFMDAVPALEDGKLDLEFRETRLGRLQVPGWVLGGPADLLALVLGLGSDYARLEALDVGAGRLTLAGRANLSGG